jgi:cytochrome c oxidase subunit II
MDKSKVIYSVLGLLVVLVLAKSFFNASTSFTGDIVADQLTSDVKEFDIIAKQWEFVPSTIQVNLGDTVRLKITSLDVTHGIAIPELKINEQIPPQKTKIIEFIASQKGEFPLICSVYCGAGHMNHRGLLIVK